MEKVIGKTKDRGFTLIELITAMSIFVIISIAMSSIFYHGLKVWKVCQNKSEMLIVGSLSIDNLIREIHEISLLNNIRFEGTASELYAVDLEADLETEKTIFRLFVDKEEKILKRERLLSDGKEIEEFFSADELNISYFYDVDGEIQESLESSADGELCAVTIGINLTNNRYGVENKLRVDRFVRIASRNR